MGLYCWGKMTDQELEESKDIIITYDTLFEILRNEKTKDDLQKLSDSFFIDAVTYLNEKQQDVIKQNEQQGLFDVDEKEKKLHQIANIKKILKDIYERREKKIINMALNKSRFSSNLIDTSALLKEEKLFYDMAISLLNSQRDKILQKMLKGQVPETFRASLKIEENPKPDINAGFESANEITNKKFELSQQKDEQSSSKLVRFLSSVPQFMGEDMLEYGPYEEEDVSKLPLEIADVLIQKGRAEAINEE